MRGNVPGHGRHPGKTAGSAGHAVAAARTCAPCGGPRTPAAGLPSAPGRLPRRPAFGSAGEARLLPGAPGPLLRAGWSLPPGRRPRHPGISARSRGTRSPLRGRRGRHVRQGKGTGGCHIRGLRRPKIRQARGRRRGRERRAAQPGASAPAAVAPDSSPDSSPDFRRDSSRDSTPDPSRSFRRVACRCSRRASQARSGEQCRCCGACPCGRRGAMTEVMMSPVAGSRQVPANPS